MNNKCPKCGEEMEKGGLLSEGNRWVAEDDLNLAGKKMGSIWGKWIVTYHCKSCGFLESYAK